MRFHLRLAVAATLCLLVATHALSRPYGVEDLLATEKIRRVEVDPTGRWAIIEVQRPWREAPRYDYGALTSLRLGRLLRVDLAHPGPAQPLFPQAPDAGYLAGPISPDGAWMLAYRVQAGRLEAGLVALASGAARWTTITPELPLWGRAAQWRGSREVLIIARSDGDLPLHLRSRKSAPDRLPGLWARTQAGVSASVTRIGSGRFLADRPHGAPNRLLALSTNGTSRVLAEADILDLEISPDQRHVALITEGADIQPQPGEQVYTAVPTRRRSLRLLELDSGDMREPPLDHDIAPGLLAWSPSGQALLAALWRPDLGPNGRSLVRLSPSGRVRPLPAPAGAFDLPPTIDGWGYVRAAWLGEDPVVFVRDAAGRADWRRLGRKGPVRLTAAIPAPTRTLLAAGADHLVVRDAQGEAWRVDRLGRARRLGTAPPAAAGLAPLQAGVRLRENPPPPRALTPARAAPLTADETLMARAPGTAIILRRQPSGVRSLRLRQDGHETPLLDINLALADLDPPERVALPHAGPRGEPLTSWLYLPPRRAPGAKLPLVVIAYRGAVYPQGPHPFDPGEFNVRHNAQILVGAGYAVLIPSLPYDPRSGAPTRDVAADILRPVDAALARGDLDPGRIGLFGHSFGGLTVVAAAAQSARFRSVIAASGVHDQFSSWGEFVPHYWVTPEDGYSSPMSLGKAERGQAGLKAPPWAAPGRYLAASNLLAANRITAPVLIIHGDLDEIRATQAQQLFSALYRQAKDAVLLTYWGEGHLLGSPANIRHEYGAILEWLAITLPAASGPSSSGSTPPPPGP